MQKPQSIYLVLAAIIIGLCPVFPYANADAMETTIATTSVFTDGLLNFNDNIALLILPALAAILAVVAIFTTSIKYKPSIYNWQRRLCYFAIALIFATLGLAAYLMMNDVVSSTVDISIIIAPVAIILLLLTSKATTRDEKIIRSANRLR